MGETLNTIWGSAGGESLDSQSSSLSCVDSVASHHGIADNDM